MRHTGFDRLPHAAEVDVDHVGPVALARLVERRAAIADACVGDDDVQPAHLLHAGVDRGLERVVIPHVDLGCVDATVVALDQIRGLGQVFGGGQRNLNTVDLLTDVDSDDVGALLRQPYRVRATLSARRTGDESDLAFNTSRHFLTSIRRYWNGFHSKNSGHGFPATDS